MAVIQHDVRRLDRLITDISSASRLDAELARAEAGPINVARLLETVVSMANDTGQTKGVAVILTCEPPLPATAQMYRVVGHDSRLVQVFNNIIDNARSFSTGGDTVRVLCRRSGAEIEITVDDDGPGIPDHALTRVFERFYTDRPNHGFGQNSGLGLSISRQIIEAHRGSIRAENRHRPDGSVAGARFTVSLPADA